MGPQGIQHSPVALEGMPGKTLYDTLSGMDETQQNELLGTLSNAQLQQLGEYSNIVTPSSAKLEPVGEFAGIQVARPASPKPEPSNMSDAELLQAAKAAGVDVSTLIQKKPEGWLSGGLGSFGVRAPVQGLAGIADLALSPVLPDNESIRGVIDTKLDNLGVGRPESSGGRILADIIEGGMGGVSISGLGRGLSRLGASGGTLAGRLGKELATSPVQQAISGALAGGASGAVRESGGDAKTQILAAILAGEAPQLKSAATKSLFKSALGPEKSAEMADVVEAFNKVGASPTLGEASGSKRLLDAEKIGRNVALTSGPYARRAEETNKALGDFVADKAAELGNTSASKAGRTYANEFESGYLPTKKAEINRLYDDYSQTLPPGTQLAPKNFARTLKELSADIPDAPALANDPNIRPSASAWGGTLRNLQSDLDRNGGKLSLGTIKQFRSAIGDQMANGLLGQDRQTNIGEIKRVYGALSQDMRDLATAVGKDGKPVYPGAEEARQRAERVFVEHKDTLEELGRIIDRNGGGDAVYQSAFSRVNKGPDLIARVYDTASPEGRKMLTSAWIREASKVPATKASFKGADFDVSAFFKNYHGMDEGARKIVFGSHGPKFYKDMETVGNVAARLQESGSQMSPGQTALAWAIYPFMALGSGAVGAMTDPTTAGALASGATTGIAGLALTFAASRRLINKLNDPKTVEWLASLDKLPRSALPVAINSYIQGAKERGDEDGVKLAEAMRQANEE